MESIVKFIRGNKCIGRYFFVNVAVLFSFTCFCGKGFGTNCPSPSRHLSVIIRSGINAALEKQEAPQSKFTYSYTDDVFQWCRLWEWTGLNGIDIRHDREQNFCFLHRLAPVDGEGQYTSYFPLWLRFQLRYQTDYPFMVNNILSSSAYIVFNS